MKDYYTKTTAIKIEVGSLQVFPNWTFTDIAFSCFFSCPAISFNRFGRKKWWEVLWEVLLLETRWLGQSGLQLVMLAAVSFWCLWTNMLPGESGVVFQTIHATSDFLKMSFGS